MFWLWKSFRSWKTKKFSKQNKDEFDFGELAGNHELYDSCKKSYEQNENEN